MKGLLFKLAALSNQKLLILTAVIAALYYFIMFDSGTDLDAKIADVDSKLQAEQVKAKESDAALKEVDLIRASVNSLGEKFKAAAQQLPTEIQNSEILRSVNTLAKSAGVNIRNQQPGEPKREDILEMIPLHVSGEGTYSEITMFFNYVASMERIAKVATFTISAPTAAEAAKFRKHTLQFDGDVVSYRYSPQTKTPQGGNK